MLNVVGRVYVPQHVIALTRENTDKICCGLRILERSFLLSVTKGLGMIRVTRVPSEA